MNKQYYFLVFCIFPSLFAMEAPPQQHIFDIISQEHSASLDDTSESIPGYRPGMPIEEFVENSIKRQLCLSPAEKFRRACMLLKNASLKNTEAPSIDEDTRNDLNILVGPYNDKSKCLVNAINHPLTAAGNAQLCARILRPLTNFSALEEHRSRLIAIDQHYDSLKKILANVSTAEAGFLSFWDPFDLFSREFQQAEPVSPLYAWLQELRPLGLFTMGIAQKIWGMAHPQNYHSAQQLFEKMGIRTTPEPYTLESAALTTINTIQHLTHAPESWARYPQAGRYALAAYQEFCLTKNIGNSLYERAHGLKGMQKKLILLARFIKVITQTKVILDQIPELYDSAQQLDIKKQPELKELIWLLDSPTFSDQPSMASHWGNIKRAYYLMVKNKTYLLSAYAALGQLDVLVATLTMSKNNSSQFTFPDFITQQGPLLVTLDYCNPLLNQETAKTNSLQLGSEDKMQPRTIMVSGPNGAGKTTNATLALPLISLMAQGLGIVPARYYCATPFCHFFTLIKNETNIARGLSLFTNLCSRARKIERLLEQNNTQPILCALDEPFSGGTDDDLAKASQYVLLETVGSQPNTLCIATIHTPLSWQLAFQHPHLFANYHASLDHTIKPGIGVLNNKEMNIRTLGSYMSQPFVDNVKKKLGTMNP